MLVLLYRIFFLVLHSADMKSFRWYHYFQHVAPLHYQISLVSYLQLLKNKERERDMVFSETADLENTVHNTAEFKLRFF